MNNLPCLPNYEIKSFNIESNFDLNQQIYILYSEFIMLQAILENSMKSSYYAFEIFTENQNLTLEELKNRSAELFAKKSKVPFTEFLKKMIKNSKIKFFIKNDPQIFMKSMESLINFRNSLAHIAGSQKFKVKYEDDSNLSIMAILCTNHFVLV